ESYDAVLSPGGAWCIRSNSLYATADPHAPSGCPRSRRSWRSMTARAGSSPVHPFLLALTQGDLLITLDEHGSVHRLRLDAVRPRQEQLVIPSGATKAPPPRA